MKIKWNFLESSKKFLLNIENQLVVNPIQSFAGNNETANSVLQNLNYIKVHAELLEMDHLHHQALEMENLIIRLVKSDRMISESDIKKVHQGVLLLKNMVDKSWQEQKTGLSN